MSLVFSDTFNSGTYTGWTAQIGLPPVGSRGVDYTLSFTCGNGGLYKDVSPITEGVIKFYHAAYVDPALTNREYITVTNANPFAPFPDPSHAVPQIVFTLYRNSGGHNNSISIRLSENNAVAAYFYSANDTFPLDGTWHGVQIVYSIDPVAGMDVDVYVDDVNILSCSGGGTWTAAAVTRFFINQVYGAGQAQIGIDSYVIYDSLSDFTSVPQGNGPVLSATTCPGAIPAHGTIIVTKTTVPSDATSFSLNAVGMYPATFSLADGDSETFVVAVGTYEISEDANPSYVTTYNVSNGSPINAITVADGETVTVDVTNTLVDAGSGAITVIKITDPIADTTSFGFTTGSTLTPNVFSLANGEQQVFTSIPAGSGYKIYENAITGYVTTYDVSNGDPHDAISVSNGENVVVTVSNVSNRMAGSGLYSVTPGATSDAVITAYLSGSIVSAEQAIPTPMWQTGMLEDK